MGRRREALCCSRAIGFRCKPSNHSDVDGWGHKGKVDQVEQVLVSKDSTSGTFTLKQDGGGGVFDRDRTVNVN